VPAWLIRVAGRGATILGGLGGGEYDVNVASAAMSVLPHHFSSAKAARELGYQPRPAADAARDAWNWFRTHGYA